MCSVANHCPAPLGRLGPRPVSVPPLPPPIVSTSFVPGLLQQPVALAVGQSLRVCLLDPQAGVFRDGWGQAGASRTLSLGEGPTANPSLFSFQGNGFSWREGVMFIPRTPLLGAVAFVPFLFSHAGSRFKPVFLKTPPPPEVFAQAWLRRVRPGHPQLPAGRADLCTKRPDTIPGVWAPTNQCCGCLAALQR